MRLNESERKQRPFTPSQKTMALLLEALGRITWAEIVNGVSARVHFYGNEDLPLDHVPAA